MYQHQGEETHVVMLTCMYSTTLSSPMSLFAVTLVAGKELGTIFSKTFRRELVMVREVMVTEAVLCQLCASASHGSLPTYIDFGLSDKLPRRHLVCY